MDIQGKKKIVVVGGGSWATANIKMLSDNVVEKEIYWWMRSGDAVEHIQQFKHNPNYLSSVEIRVPAQHISTDLKHLISIGDFILLNVPAAFLKDALKDITADDLKGKKLFRQLKVSCPTRTRL